MGGLLSMIEMQNAWLDYQMDDFPFRTPRVVPNTPKVSLPSDKQKCKPKVRHLALALAGRTDLLKKIY